MYFDKRRLQQVLLNLLTNAIKFQTDGIIVVSLHVDENHSQLLSDKCHIRVVVEDKGIGLSAQDAKKVFDLFWLSKSPISQSLNKNGNGIGLYICKKICESLEGHIKVT